MKPLPALPLALLFCSVLVIAGSLMPWVRIGLLFLSGTEYHEGRGYITLALGVGAAFYTLLLFGRPDEVSMAQLVFLLFLAGAGVGAWNWHQVVVDSGSVNTGTVIIRVSGGLVMTTIAAALGALVALWAAVSAWWRVRRRRREIVDVRTAPARARRFIPPEESEEVIGDPD